MRYRTYFAGIARSAGLFGATVAKVGELVDALRAAFDRDGPALVDVRTTRHELALPPKLTYREIKGFTLYATRTILSGEGDELVDLARDRVLQLGRHVPAVTIVIDTPERIATAFDVIDELTSERGLVTSETIPALRATTGDRRRGGLRLATHHL